MSVETATYISDLNASYPASGDPKSEGDNHLRLLKSTVKATFPNVAGAVTPTHTQLNYVTGVTSAIQTQLDAKAPLASPTFTGTPAVPTATAGTNTTQVASTAFVQAATTALSATIAASESAAATSASNASTYASNALTSANNAAASYDAFDDRYLGSKTSNPTLDNDGNALLTGALYWNSSANEMRTYNGSAWVTTYNTPTGALTSSGYTMSTARLIGRTTASTGATEEISIGSGLSLSAGTLSASASATLSRQAKTGAYTVISSDNGKIIDCTSGTFTVSLTAAATLGDGFNVQIWNTGTGDITVNPNSTETIDGVDPLTSFILKKGARYALCCDGTGWVAYAANTTGSGLASTQIGPSSQATTTRAVAIGNACQSTNATEGGTAIGSGATVSGESAIGIGKNPTASAAYAVAIGVSTTASASNSTAIGSNSSSQGSQAVTGQGAMALGGSYASGQNSFAAAVGNNTSTYGAQGSNSAVLGYLSKATGTGGYSLGYSVTSSGNYATAWGSYSSAAQYGKAAYASGQIAAVGDAQQGMMVLRASTTGSTVVMTSDAAAASTTNQLIVATGQVMAFTGTLIGKQTGSANIAAYEIKGTLVNNGGTVTMPTGTATLIGTDSITLTTSPTLAADNTNKGLTLTSGAKTATNIRWVATIYSTELTYA